MQKLVSFFVLFLTLTMSCGKLNPPISISGRINCPSRNLTTVKPEDYQIALVDSASTPQDPNRQRDAKLTKEGQFIFENLEAGHTYFLSIYNVTPTSGTKLTLSATALENALNTNQLPPKIGLSFLAADVDLNGTVDFRDVKALKDYISGTTTSLPVGFWRFIPTDGLNSSNNFVPSTTFNALSKMQKSVANYDFIQVQAGDIDLTYCK
jgi:hypothetical protein